MDNAPLVKLLWGIQILKETMKHVGIDSYMPNLNDEKLPNRDFVVNVGKVQLWSWFIANTLIPDEFGEMIDRVLTKNEKKNIIKRSWLWKYCRSYKECLKIKLKFQVRLVESNSWRTIQAFPQTGKKHRKEMAIQSAEIQFQLLPRGV